MASTQRRRSARLSSAAADEHVQEHAPKRVKPNSADPNTHGFDGGSSVNSKGKPPAMGLRPTTRNMGVIYEEEDDGFLFSRTRSKKAGKKDAAPAQEEIMKSGKGEREAKQQQPAKERKKRKGSVSMAVAPSIEIVDSTAESTPALISDDAGLRRRSARVEGRTERRESVPRTIPEAVSRPQRITNGRPETVESTTKKRPREVEEETRAEMSYAEAQTLPRDLTPEISRDYNTSGEGHRKIALPFSDTPIIKRNKELRKKGTQSGRRSSLGLRGRRASSLIDSGSSAIPHRDVQSSEFYKLISSDGLPEPRRMRQLLTWCGERALGEKPSPDAEDGHAKLAARVIEEELLKEFSTRGELSNWFDREEVPTAPILLKENPRNRDNAEKLKELERQLERLKEERKAWELISNTPRLPSPPTPPPYTVPSLDAITPSLLDASDEAILASLQHHVLPPPLSALTANLELSIDTFAAGMHSLAAFQGAADRVAAALLDRCAESLRRREEAAKEEVGTRDVDLKEVLRSLSRVE
ncbi:MAG: hypothetical protein M1829_005093 [Trizodia sp. TS-e1964]|nr:MAG: hypothetical protein M1829_005093 [Trizodia sp. TS-e1964]